MPVYVHLCLRVCLFHQTGSPSGAGTTTAPSALSRWGCGRSYVLCVSPHELSSLGELIPALSFKSHLLEEDVWGRRRGGVDALTSTPPQISLSHRSFFFFFCFLGPHSWHVEVPRLGVELELQPPAYITATLDPSCVCNLHHSSLTYRVRPGIEPASSWILGRFVSAVPQWEFPILPSCR